MRNGGEGARFLAAFSELRAAVGDDPDKLASSWEGNAHLERLCDEIHHLVWGFDIEEEWSPYTFTHHVSASGARARRDYEERWQQVIGTVAGRDLLFLLTDLLKVPDKEADPDPFEDRLGDDIADWKDSAETDARRFEQLIDFALSHQEVDDSGDLDWVHDGLRAWDRLKVAGLDIEGVLWRRRAIPHVLVPSHVAEHYGASRASLYRRLHQSGRAFIFGAPLAALALQRAVLEEVLRTHWGSATGAIREAKLPELSWDSRASRLKRLANEALHRDPEILTADQLDRAIIENFLLLRLLIEHAPENLHERASPKQ